MTPKTTNAFRGLLLLALAAALAGCVDARGTRSVVQAGPTTLQAVQVSVFTPRCATSGCHTGGGPFGLDLSNGLTAGNTIGVSSAEVPAYDRITPYDAANSYLYMKISGDPRLLGDPMPAPPNALLTPQQVQLVADWINAGAIE